MKRYRYSIKNDPEHFSAALEYLKDIQECTDTPKEFFYAQDIWNTIPTNLDMYFTYRPYLEIMGLQELADKELKRIIGKEADKWYPYDEKYGYYAPVYGSGSNIIQISCPIRCPETEPSDEELVPYDEWEIDEEAIKQLSRFVVEEIPELEIEMVPPVDGVNVS